MAARQVGCPAILVGAGKANVDAKEWASGPEAIVADLYAAVQLVLGQRGRNQSIFNRRHSAILDGS